MRQFLTIVLPIIVPIGAYWLYITLAGRKAEHEGTGDEAPGWGDAPWILMGLAGVILLIAILVAFRFQSAYDRDVILVPPQLIDGQIVPAHPEDPADPED